MFDVYFYEAFEEERAAIMRYCPASVRAGYTHKTIQEENLEERPAGIISIRTQSVIPPAWAKSMNAILSRSAGYDHLTAYRLRTGTAAQLGYLPRYCARAVAEQALMLWMSLLRKLPRQVRQFDSFHRDGITGLECQGRTLVVVGVGNIGRHIVDLGRAMDMRVIAVDPVRKHADLEYMEFAEALPQADVLVCAMNLTAANKGYFSYERMKAAAPGALFINIARGEFASPSVLKQLLDEQILGGIALDVYPGESDLAVRLRGGQGFNDNPDIQAIAALRGDDRVILTPHNAFNTEEAVERKASQSIEQVQHLLQHGRFLWPVPADQ